ncbi:hypothetical protein PUNSTDRAFT_146454, partial [Punctularia strigosozonata HHB-11173 SS5]
MAAHSPPPPIAGGTTSVDPNPKSSYGSAAAQNLRSAIANADAARSSSSASTRSGSPTPRTWLRRFSESLSPFMAPTNANGPPPMPVRPSDHACADQPGAEEAVEAPPAQQTHLGLSASLLTRAGLLPSRSYASTIHLPPHIPRLGATPTSQGDIRASTMQLSALPLPSSYSPSLSPFKHTTAHGSPSILKQPGSAVSTPAPIPENSPPP